MSIAVKRVKPWHIRHIARNCREVDRKEIYLYTMLTPLDALEVCVENSVACWTGTWKGTPIVMFGVCRENLLGEVGIPWLVGTPELEVYQIGFLRRCKKYFDRMKRAFPRLENHVWVENTTAIQWLKWMGFEMDEPKQFGLGRANFIRFWIEK